MLLGASYGALSCTLNLALALDTSVAPLGGLPSYQVAATTPELETCSPSLFQPDKLVCSRLFGTFATITALAGDYRMHSRKKAFGSSARF